MYRVWGDQAKATGQWWTTTNPSTVANFRGAAGLPTGNAGRFVSEGIIADGAGIRTGTAARIGENSGGLPELVIPDPVRQVILTRVSGVNPPF